MVQVGNIDYQEWLGSIKQVYRRWISFWNHDKSIGQQAVAQLPILSFFRIYVVIAMKLSSSSSSDMLAFKCSFSNVMVFNNLVYDLDVSEIVL